MRNMIANIYIFASVQYQYIYLLSRQGSNDSHDILIRKKNTSHWQYITISRIVYLSISEVECKELQLWD